jgi:hypothetical protein
MEANEDVLTNRLTNIFKNNPIFEGVTIPNVQKKKLLKDTLPLLG